MPSAEATTVTSEIQPTATVGRTLRAQRVLAGVRAETIAEVLGVSAETIRAIERRTDEVPGTLVVRYMFGLQSATQKEDR